MEAMDSLDETWLEEYNRHLCPQLRSFTVQTVGGPSSLVGYMEKVTVQGELTIRTERGERVSVSYLDLQWEDQPYGG